MTAVASFDVFDTTLIRGVTDPTSLFLSIGRRLPEAGVDLSPFAFRAARVAAERLSRENIGAAEVTLEEVYNELAEALGWAPQVRAAVMGWELEAEARTLRPNPRVRDRIKAARAAGKRVVFISDMYLPTGFIRDCLRHADLWLEGDRCYVSSEYRATKNSGLLFERMLKQEHVPVGSWEHTGDHFASDVGVVQRLGGHATHICDTRANRFEAAMEALAAETDGLAALYAGTARSVRLSGPREQGREAILWEAAAGVAAPMLAAYVVWLLREAERAGVRRLYFLARDGYLLLRIAEKLAPALGFGVELRYLYGSRRAWHLPAVRALGREHLGWVLDPTHQLNPRVVLGRIGLSPEEVAGDLSAAGFPPDVWDDPLGSAIDRLGEAMMRPGITSAVAARAAEQRELVRDYLRQEGMMDGRTWAVVDLGWNGRLQASLRSLLGTDAPDPVRGYYFALHNRPPTEAGDLHAYYADRVRGRGRTRNMPAATMMEMFCTTADGTTEGYVRRGGRVEPRFAPGGEHVKTWGVELIHAAVMAFAAELAGMGAELLRGADLRGMVEALKREWWDRPDQDHAAVWSGFPYEDDQIATSCPSVASPYSWRDCLWAARYRRWYAPRSRIEWVEASRALTPSSRRIFLAATQRGWNALRCIRGWLRPRHPRTFGGIA